MRLAFTILFLVVVVLATGCMVWAVVSAAAEIGWRNGELDGSDRSDGSDESDKLDGSEGSSGKDGVR